MFRVSEVESFRQWRDDEAAELDQLLARLRGMDLPSPAMLAGIAFHKALELTGEGVVDELSANGYRFLIPAHIEIDLPEIRELRASKVYLVDGEPIAITGQVDALTGFRVDDHKTTSRFDPERYLSGYQWRLYLEIFGATLFRWNVFEIAELTGPAQTYEVRAHHQIQQYRYHRLTQDCEALVRDFARFVRAFVPERCEQRKAA